MSSQLSYKLSAEYRLYRSLIPASILREDRKRPCAFFDRLVKHLPERFKFVGEVKAVTPQRPDIDHSLDHAEQEQCAGIEIDVIPDEIAPDPFGYEVFEFPDV